MEKNDSNITIQEADACLKNEEKKMSYATLNQYFNRNIYKSIVAYILDNTNKRATKEEDALWFFYYKEHIEAYLHSIGFDYLKLFKVENKVVDNGYNTDEYVEFMYEYNEQGDMVVLKIADGFCIKTIEKSIRVESKKLANTEFPCISKETYVVNHDITITLKEPTND